MGIILAIYEWVRSIQPTVTLSYLEIGSLLLSALDQSIVYEFDCDLCLSQSDMTWHFTVLSWRSFVVDHELQLGFAFANGLVLRPTLQTRCEGIFYIPLNPSFL